MLEVAENTIVKTNGRRVSDDIVFPEQIYEDMGETSFHSKLINNFLQLLLFFFRDRQDVFIASNLNVYFDEENPTRWFAPDIFVVFGVPNNERRSYKIWEENAFPQVVFEVASERTWKSDVTDKYETYEILGAEEYYLLDPEMVYLPAPLMAYQRLENRLRPAAVTTGRIFSPRLGLEIVQVERGYRLFNPESGRFLMTLAEIEEERRQLLAEIERLKAQK